MRNLGKRSRGNVFFIPSIHTFGICFGFRISDFRIPRFFTPDVTCTPDSVERPAGIAPASPDWHSGILLLNDGRVENDGGAGGNWCAPAPRNDKKNKHRCP